MFPLTPERHPAARAPDDGLRMLCALPAHDVTVAALEDLGRGTHLLLRGKCGVFLFRILSKNSHFCTRQTEHSNSFSITLLPPPPPPPGPPPPEDSSGWDPDRPDGRLIKLQLCNVHVN